ncbi:MAG: hypothetical protein QM617_04965 [Comamonas sp.]
MRSGLFIAICLLLAGCAVNQPVLTWTPTRDDATPVDRAVDRCQYETTSATQTPDYSVGYWLQGIDQKQRRNNLMILCMRAQGYAAKAVSEGVGPQSKATWKRWEDEWAAAKEERALIRSQLVANPTGPDAAQMSDRIRQLNAQVRELERRLSYSPSRPVSADPYQ